MKTILIVLFSLTFSFSNYGQISEMASVDLNETIKTTKVDKLANNRSLKKNQKAIALFQLNTFLAEHLKYEEILSDNVLESEIVLEVTIDGGGKIESTEIISSTNSYFDKIVQETISKMDSIDVSTEKYYGPRKLAVPISFSID